MNSLLRFLRSIGLYHGPIHYRVRAKGAHLGVRNGGL